MTDKKVVELYRELLPAMGLTLGNNDQIYIGGGELGEAAAVKIDTKNLYLPTETFLKDSEYREQVAFHPLAEDILKKRSPVLTAMQNGLSVRLLTSGIFLIEGLLNACVKQGKGEEISNPRLLKYISNNEQCDEKTLLFFKKLTAVIQEDTSKKLFNVYLRHANEQNDGHSRQCVIASPLVTELERIASIGSTKTGGLVVWGVESPRKKDVSLLAELIKSLFPGIENRSYSTGSLDKIAPYCDAFFNALKPINLDIAAAAQALAKVEPVSSVINYLCIDLTPIDNMLAMKEDYDILRNQIVKTAYNDGDGWTTDIKRPGEVERPQTEVVRERSRNEHNQATEDPVAITKQVIVNSVKPIPGTRQPLLANVKEEDYRTVQTKPRHPSGRNSDYRGYEYPERDRSRSSSRSRYYIDDFRDSRDIEDEIIKVKKKLRDAEYERDRDLEEDYSSDLRDLRDLFDRMRDEEDRGRNYSSRDRGGDRDRDDRRRDSDGRRSSRPRPRVIDNERDRDRDRRPERDRFGRR